MRAPGPTRDRAPTSSYGPGLSAGSREVHDDAFVSRYFNRPLSRPVARAMSHTPLPPEAITLVTLLLAGAAGATIAAGLYVAGGVLIQVVSVAGSVHGELARTKGTATKFGAVLDAVAGRYADAAVLAGMTAYAVRFEDHAHAETAGVLALAGALVVSYGHARIEASLPDALEAANGQGDRRSTNLAPMVLTLGSRDVRLLIAAVGTVLGQCYWTLILLAILTGVMVGWRLLYLRLGGVGTAPV